MPYLFRSLINSTFLCSLAAAMSFVGGGVAMAQSIVATGNVAPAPPSSTGSWTVNSTIVVGDLNSGSLTVSGGGMVNNVFDLYVGRYVGASGTLTIQGANSSLTSGGTSTTYIGQSGAAMVNILNGGSLTVGQLHMAFSAGSTANVVVDGAGSILVSNYDPIIGRLGTADVVVSNGGTFRVSGSSRTLNIASYNGASATLAIGGKAGAAAAAPGILDVALVQFGNGLGSLTFNHTATDYVFSPNISASTSFGTISFQAGGTILTGTVGGAVNISSGINVRVGNGGTAGVLNGVVTNNGSVTFNRSDNSLSNTSMTGTGSVTKSGAGILTVVGSFGHTGGTTISEGTLQIGSGYTSGSISGNITNNGALVFNRSNDFSFSDTISGTGRIEKQGTGTLTLTGSKSYSGGTTISAGTLAGAANSFGSGAIINNATLSVSGALGTLSNSISGTGSLTKTGGGTIILSGINTYSGGTTISAGTLISAVSGLGTGAITNNGTLQLAEAADGALASAISGTGSLTKTGAGMLTLSGTNSYTGVTTISAGTLAGSVGSFGMGNISVANGAKLSVAAAEDATFTNAITGAGSLTTAGAGILTLSGANNYSGGTTISSGTLTGFVSSFGAGAITNNGALSIRADTDATFVNAISGTGSFTKTGTGALTFSGFNSFGGALNIDDGILVLTTALAVGQASIVNVAAGATLQVDSVATTIKGLSGAGTVNLGNQVLKIGDPNGDLSTTFSGMISGTGAETAIEKRGTGTLTLSGVNSYSGHTNVKGGAVSILQDASLGTGIVWLEGGALQTTADIISTRGMIMGGGNGTFDVVGNTTLTLNGQITGKGGLIKTGTGTLVLGGSNSYEGITYLNAGTLVAANENALAGSADLIITDGATFLTAFNQELGSLSGDSGQIGLDNHSTLTVGSDGTTTQYGGQLTGNGSLTKVGAGTLTLTGANSYTGTTRINEGELALAEPGSLSDQTLVTIAEGATFRVTADNAVIGGLEGAGTLHMARDLSVGGNNANTVFSGTIDARNSTLAKIGNGTLTLDGDYAAPFRIDAGTLRIGNGGTSGSLGGDVVNNGTLTFDRTDTATYAGSVSGSGIIQQNGMGTLVLTGENVNTGGVSITAGTLQIGDGGTSGSTTGPVVNFGTLAFNRADNVSFSNSIAGTGGLVQQGAGTLTLSGANSYGGGTQIRSGTILVDSDAALGSASSGVTLDGGTLAASSSFTSVRKIEVGDNNGTLQVSDAATALTLSGALSGQGNLTKTGAGTLIISSDVTLAGSTTISEGTLQLGDGGTSGSLSGPIINKASLVFNRSGSYASPNQLSGTGSVTFQGGGTVDFGSTNFAGAIVLDNSTLTLQNGIISVAEFVVQAGGRLGGSATIGGLTVNDGGVVAPGYSPGKLTVSGPVTFNGGAIYAVDVTSAGEHDLITANGPVIIDSGASVLLLAGASSPSSTYTILSTTGGVSGRFGSVSTDYAYLTPTLSYDAQNVYLTLTYSNGDDTGFVAYAQTFNQVSVANAAQSLGQGNAVFDAIVPLTVAAVPGAFNALSGEVYASVQTSLVEGSRHVREGVLGRLDAAADEADVAFTTSGPGEDGAMAAGGGLSAWLQGYGSWGETHGNGNAAELSNDTGGFLVGADGLVSDQMRLGFAAGYGQASLNADDRGFSADVDSYHFGVYAGSELGAVVLKGGAAYSWNSVESKRSVSFVGFSDSLSAGYDSGTAQVFGEAGYRFDVTPATRVEPFVGLAYVHLGTDGFTESDSASRLAVSSQTFDATFSTLGIKASTHFMLGTVEAQARGSIGWRHAYGDLLPIGVNSFLSGPGFTVEGVGLAEDAAVIDVGLDLAVSEDATLGLRYNGQFGDGVTNNGVSARFMLTF